MFGALVPVSYQNEPSQSTINTTTISNNTQSISDLRTELQQLIGDSDSLLLNVLRSELATEVNQLQAIIDEQAQQIADLIEFANSLRGIT